MEENIFVMVESSNDSMAMRLKWRVKRFVIAFLPPPGGPMAHTKFCGGESQLLYTHTHTHTHTNTHTHTHHTHNEDLPHQSVQVENCLFCRTSVCDPPTVSVAQLEVELHTSPSVAYSGHPQTTHICIQRERVCMITGRSTSSLLPHWRAKHPFPSPVQLAHDNILCLVGSCTGREVDHIGKIAAHRHTHTLNSRFSLGWC